MNPTTTAALRDGVRKAYSAAALEPDAKHPFPVGAAFAASLGYPEEVLQEAPAASLASFAGVANVSCFAPIREGVRVLDLGCGSGLDSYVSAHRAGSKGETVAVDFSLDMLRRARHAGDAQASRILFLQASAEQLPLPDASIDVALVNGIFNLNPDRERLFPELARVLRPGGTVAGAELILKEPIPVPENPSPESWFS
ncbi:MAG: methyltransferase domain-containing protein [Bryobacterales bacterium]|nr:methyltransferase domain-containing protein [Bryobacterales bacterium]